MDLMLKQDNYHVLTIEQIASWAGIEVSPPPEIVARVPSLQRGEVWEPQQIELLWDSLLRGFPIGSVVVCKHLHSNLQSDRKQKFAESSVTPNRHILDGQQRINAIALGFSDPFNGNEPQQVLWLDLAPKGTSNSTRNFWVHMTTTAHPWGYKRDDQANRLSASEIRKALQNYGWRDAEDEFKLRITHPSRPPLTRTWPYSAEYPVPLAWLLKAAKDTVGSEKPASQSVFWNIIKERCQNPAVSKFEWAKRLSGLLDHPETVGDLRHAVRGLRRAIGTGIVALEVPNGALRSASKQEKENPHSVEISNVEHIFQRLNRGGTPLQGDELAYSMIKAYWPELEPPITNLASTRKLMPDSKLAVLGTRLALIADPADKNRLPSPPTVSRLRSIAQSKTEQDKERKELIRRQFIGSQPTTLRCNIDLLDNWLLWREDHQSGLPPVLRTRIARERPSIYLLLMHAAKRALQTFGTDARKETLAVSPYIIGLATALDWFGHDHERAVQRLYSKWSHPSWTPSREALKGCLTDCMALDDTGRFGVAKILSPAEIKSTGLIPKTSEMEEFRSWNWYKVWDELNSQEGNKRDQLWLLLDRLRNSKELLLYAQRNFLVKAFSDYDPAREDLWSKHNRPWDFDHILPSKYYHGKWGAGNYKAVCREWAVTIGNLRAWPFEDNRSDQATTAKEKILSAEELTNSFIKDQFELESFSFGSDVIYDEEEARTFAGATRSRILRIYDDWYHTAKIGFLMNEK